MKHFLKQFEVLGTDLKHNLFESARVRLMLFYIITMVLIMGMFSAALIATTKVNIGNSLARTRIPFEIRKEIFDDAINDFQNAVIIVDGVLIIIIACAGYFLAGRTLRPIRKSLEAQKRFTADASHDLRTPLAIMKSELEVLIQCDVQDLNAYKDAVKSNLEEIDKMSLLVSDLLTIARIEDARNKEDHTDIDINTLIKNIEGKINKQAQAKKISVISDTQSTGTARGRTHDIERVLQNIIQNAINNTPSNGTINISTTSDDASIHIHIKDSGIGIDKKDLPHVFERFYKASGSRKDDGGSGLGLSIAKQIIEQYGGTIKIESALGQGTKVAIRLPRKNS